VSLDVAQGVSDALRLVAARNAEREGRAPFGWLNTEAMRLGREIGRDLKRAGVCEDVVLALAFCAAEELATWTGESARDVLERIGRQLE
jgi:hypothetical protein